MKAKAYRIALLVLLGLLIAHVVRMIWVAQAEGAYFPRAHYAAGERLWRWDFNGRVEVLEPDAEAWRVVVEGVR